MCEVHALIALAVCAAVSLWRNGEADKDTLRQATWPTPSARISRNQ